MAPSTGRLNLRNATVLVVDDNPMSLELLTQILGGFRVQKLKSCLSAMDAQRLIIAEEFDLLLIDGEMAGQSGIEFTRFIRSRVNESNFTVPIMIVSAFATFKTVQYARDNGANMVVSKPVSPAILLSRIELIARSKRPFVISDTYCGPDRRFKRGLAPDGMEERRADALALTAAPEREMSQDELDSLFG